MKTGRRFCHKTCDSSFRRAPIPKRDQGAADTGAHENSAFDRLATVEPIPRPCGEPWCMKVSRRLTQMHADKWAREDGRRNTELVDFANGCGGEVFVGFATPPAATGTDENGSNLTRLANW